MTWVIKFAKITKMRKSTNLILASLLMLAACKNNDKPHVNEVKPTPSISYAVVNTFPHDTGSYTQGLLFYNGELYEGTGLEGRSKLMKVDLKTGKALQSISIDPKLFGEGVVILHDTVYQLTWQNKLALVYSLKDFKKIKEVPMKPDGWGLTTDGTQLIASDGTSTLYFYEPSTLRLIRTQDVTEGGGPATNLNELEYINGFIYANQYQEANIFKINPTTGEIVAKIDLTNLWNQVKTADPNAEVPNGIAYDDKTGKVYVTGKLWPSVYEVKFGE